MKKGFKWLVLFSFVFAIGFANINVSSNNKNLSAITINPDNNISATATIPTHYDLRDYIDIGVENQNPYGICFAYASLTSLETYLALNYGEYYDFSELHFALSLYFKDGYYDSIDHALNDGGNFNHFALYTQKDKSLVLEDEMPKSKYTGLNKYTKMQTDFNNINNNFYSVAKVNNTVSFDEYVGNKSQYSSYELTNFRNKVKNHIMQYGSLTAGIHSSDNFTYSTINYKITDDSLVATDQLVTYNTNHLISIVGWDDNYDANGAWANKGAYLCLNSWGTTFGDGGYFYVSYDDYFIESTIQGVTDASLSTSSHKISTITNHQNNTFILAHTLNNNLYVANILNTSNFIGEQVNYIDSFIKGGTAKFYINFFQSKSTAIANINNITVMNIKSSTRVGEYSLYNKYQLSSPLEIANDYMVIITEVPSAYKIYSLGGYTKNNLNLDTTYYTGNGLTRFNTTRDVWDPQVSDQYGTVLETDATIPIILHTNKTYIKPLSISGDMESFKNSKYLQNNAIYVNKTISIELENHSFTNLGVANIKIIKLYANGFGDVSSSFQINKASSSKITIKQTDALPSGQYLVKIPCGDTTVCRVIEVQDTMSYPIAYHLDGGQANNPIAYTNTHTTLTLKNPVKDGYIFVGWYTDADFESEFNPNNLPYTSLNLYAKYDFACPEISSKTNNVNISYYDGLEVDIDVTATHALVNTYNTLSYQWYTRKTLSDDYVIVSGATSNSLKLHNVNESGYYACQVTITIGDNSLVASPTTRTLEPGQNTEIYVNIKPYIYDMSKASWNYTEAISYDTNVHAVEVVNLPDGVTVNYTNNQASAIGTYLATAELVYDNMDGNAVANPIENLTWQIRPAKITITINNINSTTALSSDVLSNMFSCTIENEYLPSGIISLQDKINYLELKYKLQDTAQAYIKTITATTKSFDTYDIEIVNGKYSVVVYKLNDNNITTSSQNGFVKDCTFSATTYQVDSNTATLLKDKNLTLIDGYNINYSYLSGDEVSSINVPLPRNVLFNNISVYMLKDGKLIKMDNVDITSSGISLSNSEKDATYLICIENYSYNTNTQMIVLISIIGTFVALCIYALIVGIRHKRNYF